MLTDYVFSKARTEEEMDACTDGMIKELRQEYTPLNKVDYCIDEAGQLPISFASITSVEQGIHWYSEHYGGRFPPGVIESMARYQFGDRVRSSGSNSSKDGASNKGKKKPEVFSITKGIHKITFD